jgi:hypothetical protein
MTPLIDVVQGDVNEQDRQDPQPEVHISVDNLANAKVAGRWPTFRAMA